MMHYDAISDLIGCRYDQTSGRYNLTPSDINLTPLQTYRVQSMTE